MSGEMVTYLDFGTMHLHLGHSSVGRDVALCGFGAARPLDAASPASFKDRPGLFPAEMCVRCLRSAAAQSPQGDNQTPGGTDG